MRGAGGTEGGLGSFFIGFIMMCSGFYMLLSNITVHNGWGWGRNLYSFGGGYGISGGMILIPFMFGIGMLFYNADNIFAWLLSIGSVAALIIGVISSIKMSFRGMSLFELLVILILALGGTGLFLRSLKPKKYPTNLDDLDN